MKMNGTPVLSLDRSYFDSYSAKKPIYDFERELSIANQFF